MMNLQGSWVAMPTPFTEDNQVDIEGFKLLIARQIKYGTNQLFILGSAGEVTLLSIEEKKLIVKSVIAYMKDRAARGLKVVPVFFSAASFTTEASVEFAQFCEAEGADGVVFTVPPYVLITQHAAKTHLDTCMSSVSIPCGIYNNPSRLGVQVLPETIKYLSEKHPNFVVDKEAIGVALMPIGIVMSNAIGGDAFLAFLIIYYGLQSGFSIGFANPSILGVAQTMAEIPIFSGTNVRVVCCLANITFLYIVTMLYYRRIRKDPTKSLNYGSDFHSAFEVSSDKVDSKMTKRQILTAAVFLLGVVLCVGLTIACKWNAKKIASYFFGMMIVIGLVSGFSMNEISDKFIKGCKPMIYASFITGLASAIAVILNQGKVLDTIVYALSIPLNQVGAVVGAGLMVVVNVIVNIFIPSGSGQAAVMIPLMTPIADLVGITRQVAVQAFQFGDGLCNLLTPLNGPMMGCLAMVGIGFPKYIKWAFKYLMMNIGAAIVITMVLQAVGWVGF